MPTVVVIIYLVYKKHRRSSKNDYISDNTIINSFYEAGQELQSRQVQEMVSMSSKTEPPTQKLLIDDSEGESTMIKKQNFDANTNKDTHF